MAKKGVKMNLADFNGPQQTDLPSAPTGAESSFQRGAGGRGGGRGGYGGDRGDRDGGRDGGAREGGRSYGDREERGPRRGRGEDGEEEEEAPSRADEADKWRRRDAPQQERRTEEMPGRSDNEDKWRPRGGAPSSGGGFGGERRSYGGDRDSTSSSRYGGDRDGGRDGGRSFGDRDGGRDGGRSYGGDRDGERRGGGFDSERRSGGFDDRRGGGGFGGDSGDSRPAHLKNLVKRGNSSNDLAGDRAAGSADAAAAAPAPVSSRFAKPPPEVSETGAEDEQRPAREERRPYGGDRDGAERRPYGGDRDGAERRPYGGDRDGGERRPYGGDRDGGERRSYGGDRDGGERRPYGGSSGGGGGGGRFGDRDGGRDGGRPSGGYGGNRDGGYEPRPAATGVSRYGGYGGAARTGGAGSNSADMMGPLPSGPRQQQDNSSFDDAPRSALRKPVGSPAAAAAAAAAKKKEELTAKPQSMEERNVEVDESLTKKGVVSLAQKISPLEAAVAENLTITSEQLADSMNRLKIDSIKSSTVADFGNVLAKSIVDGKITLAKLVANLSSSKSASAASAPSSGVASLLLETLVAFKSKKGDKALLEMVTSSGLLESIVSTVSGGLKGAELDAFLDAKSIIILKPVPDLTESVAADLAAGVSADKILQNISAAVDPKLAPGLRVTNAVAAFVFNLVFTNQAGKVDLSVLPTWSPLIARVAPGFDADAQLRVLFEAQAAWFKAGATKAILKETFVALHAAKLVQPLVFDAWRNDMVEKSKNGKSKALLQVHTWITDIQPKLRPSEEEQYGADEDLANEYGDADD